MDETCLNIPVLELSKSFSFTPSESTTADSENTSEINIAKDDANKE